MDDLIKRQDAIKALGDKGLITAMIVIDKVPSAEHHKLNIAEYIHDLYPDVWKRAEKELEVQPEESGRKGNE